MFGRRRSSARPRIARTSNRPGDRSGGGGVDPACDEIGGIFDKGINAMDTSIPWLLAVVGGPLILGGVLLWAILNNRMSRRQKEQSDEGARQLRRELDEESRRKDAAH